MRLLDRLRSIGREPTGKAEPVSKKKTIYGHDVLGGFLDFSSNKLSGEKNISTKILQANKGWVYSNNHVIAQEVSKMEFELYTLGLSQGEIVYNQIDSHPLLDLLDKPNEEATTSDAIYTIQGHRKLSGDAFWVKLRTNGVVTALRTLPPDKVTLNLQTPTEKDPTTILNYEYKDVIDGQKINIIYDPKDIIHFKKPSLVNSFRGYGVVEALSDTIDLDNLTTETTKKYFLNGAITNFVLTTPNKITQEQVTRLRAELRSTHGGVSNAYKAMILGGGLEPKDISYTNKDMEFIAQLEWYRDKIMIGFGNTKASLGIIDDVNRASHESSLGEWLRNTVKPDMQAIVDTLNEFLVPEFGENLVLGFLDPVPDDRTDDIEEATKLYQGNIISRMEARDMLGYDTDEKDNVFYQPTTGLLTDGVLPEDEPIPTGAPNEEE